MVLQEYVPPSCLFQQQSANTYRFAKWGSCYTIQIETLISRLKVGGGIQVDTPISSEYQMVN